MARLTMGSPVVRDPGLRPALPHHLAQLSWNAASLEDSHWNEAARTANLSADGMELSIGHHRRQTDALEKPDFVFELHVPNVSRNARLLQSNCLLGSGLLWTPGAPRRRYQRKVILELREGLGYSVDAAILVVRVFALGVVQPFIGYDFGYDEDPAGRLPRTGEQNYCEPIKFGLCVII